MADDRQPSRQLGMLLVIVGVALNPWSFGVLFSPDGRVDSLQTRLAIIALQIVCILLGGLIAFFPSRRLSSLRYLRVSIPVVLLLACVGIVINVFAMRADRTIRTTDSLWSEMVQSEELIGRLNQKLRHFDASILNLRLPHHASVNLFTEQVSVVDVAATAETNGHVGPQAVRRNWTIEEQPRISRRNDLQLWQQPLQHVSYFDHAKFFVVEGRFLDSSFGNYEAKIGFHGLARLKSGGYAQIQSTQRVVWQQVNESQPSVDWQVAAWRMIEFQAVERQELLFRQVEDQAIPEPSTASGLRESRFERLWRDYMKDESVLEEPDRDPARVAEMFSGTSPGLTVIDLDRDGFDDLFILNSDQSYFLRNQANGKFKDATEELGVDTHEAVAATFADFDNDGDFDLLLGRNRARSSYYVYEGGRFRDSTKAMVDGLLPNLVSSIACADYDQDGLLDIYISTYGYSPLSFEHMYPSLRTGDLLLGKYLTRDDAVDLDKLVQAPDFNLTMNAPGPPNVLLRNQGEGRFRVVALPNELRLFRNSFHAAWADYDEDGDPDLYVANDYAPNNLLRNEGGG